MPQSPHTRRPVTLAAWFTKLGTSSTLARASKQPRSQHSQRTAMSDRPTVNSQQYSEQPNEQLNSQQQASSQPAPSPPCACASRHSAASGPASDERQVPVSSVVCCVLFVCCRAHFARQSKHKASNKQQAVRRQAGHVFEFACLCSAMYPFIVYPPAGDSLLCGRERCAVVRVAACESRWG